MIQENSLFVNLFRHGVLAYRGYSEERITNER